MSEVKWIKIVTDIFDDEKILLIEAMPAADSIITIWFKLLCLAGKQNNSGVFMLNNRIPYTDEMFATIFRRELNTVRMALNTFQELGMVEIVNGTVTIPNWSKHQTLDQLERKTEYMRNYMAKKRAEQKLIAGGKANSKTNSQSNSQVNVSCADIDIEEELEKDIDKNSVFAYASTNLNGLSPTHYQELVSFTEDLPEDVIRYAIDEACANNARNWAYTRAILNNFVDNDVDTVEKAKELKERRKEKRKTEEDKIAEKIEKSKAKRKPMDEREISDDEVWFDPMELMNRPRGNG